MALFGVKGVLEMILSHTAPSSFNMSSYPNHIWKVRAARRAGGTGGRDKRAAGAGGRAPAGTKTIEKKNREGTAKKRKGITINLNVVALQIVPIQHQEHVQLMLHRLALAIRNTSVLAYGNADNGLYG